MTQIYAAGEVDILFLQFAKNLPICTYIEVAKRLLNNNYCIFFKYYVCSDCLSKDEI